MDNTSMVSSSCCREPKILGGRCDNCGEWVADNLGAAVPPGQKVGTCTDCGRTNVVLHPLSPKMCLRCVQEMDEENEGERMADEAFARDWD